MNNKQKQWYTVINIRRSVYTEIPWLSYLTWTCITFCGTKVRQLHCSVLWSPSLLISPHHSPQFTFFSISILYLPVLLWPSNSAALCPSLSQLLWWRFALHWTRVMADEGVTTRGTNRERKQRLREHMGDDSPRLIWSVVFFLTHRFLTWGMPLEENYGV